MLSVPDSLRHNALVFYQHYFPLISKSMGLSKIKTIGLCLVQGKEGLILKMQFILD